jgi:hypothetical protein
LLALHCKRRLLQQSLNASAEPGTERLSEILGACTKHRGTGLKNGKQPWLLAVEDSLKPAHSEQAALLGRGRLESLRLLRGWRGLLRWLRSLTGLLKRG